MSRRARPWWLTDGAETCHACTHLYFHEMVLRCAGCDRGICAQCVVIERVTRDAWCPECRAEQQATAGARDAGAQGRG